MVESLDALRARLRREEDGLRARLERASRERPAGPPARENANAPERALDRVARDMERATLAQEFNAVLRQALADLDAARERWGQAASPAPAVPAAAVPGADASSAERDALAARLQAAETARADAESRLARLAAEHEARLAELTALQSRQERREVAFSLEFPQAVRVAVAGDFNGWCDDPDSPTYVPLVRDARSRWSASLLLSPGRYQYRFVVDGQRWMMDPQNPEMETDAQGHNNSVLHVSGRAEELEKKIQLLEMKVVHRDEEIQSLKRAFEAEAARGQQALAEHAEASAGLKSRLESAYAEVAEHMKTQESLERQWEATWSAKAEAAETERRSLEERVRALSAELGRKEREFTLLKDSMDAALKTLEGKWGEERGVWREEQAAKSEAETLLRARIQDLVADNDHLRRAAVQGERLHGQVEALERELIEKAEALAAREKEVAAQDAAHARGLAELRTQLDEAAKEIVSLREERKRWEKVAESLGSRPAPAHPKPHVSRVKRWLRRPMV